MKPAVSRVSYRKTISTRMRDHHQISQDEEDQIFPTKVCVDQKCGIKQSALLKKNRRSMIEFGGNYQPERFNPKKYAVRGLSERDVRQLKDIFDKLDSTGAGSLTPGDLSKVLHRYGYNASKETVYDIIAEYDLDQDGGVKFNEFMKIMTERPPEKETKGQLKKVFRKFDKKNKGYIDLNDIRQVSIEVNEDLDDEALKSIMRKADRDHDGKIGFEDFYTVMHQMKYYR